MKKLEDVSCLHSFSFPHPACPPGHYSPMPFLVPQTVPGNQVWLDVPEFTETATSLNLKTVLLLIQPKVITSQFSDRMTPESSVAPLVTLALPAVISPLVQGSSSVPGSISERQQECLRSELKLRLRTTSRL